MDIIQQKLIWILGSLTMLILLFKLNFRCAGLVDRNVLNRFKIGLGLLFFGSLAGLIFRIGIFTRSIPHLWSANLAEILVGYIAGWSFVIWGAARWARRYFDKKGKPLPSAFARPISEKISIALNNGRRPNQLLAESADDICQIMSCEALTLHRVTVDGGMRMTFDAGLTRSTREKIISPLDKNNLIWKARTTGFPITGNRDLVFGDGSRLRSFSGALSNAMALPVRHDDEVLGVLTLFRKSGLPFDEADSEMMENICAALGTSIVSEMAQMKYNLVSRYGHMLSEAVRPFESDEPLFSALIKSAKIVHAYVPFADMTLFIHGDGKPQNIDFSLRGGGVVCVKTGYFSASKFPRLYSDHAHGRISEENLKHVENKEDGTFIFEIGDPKRPTAHLTLRLDDNAGRTAYLNLLGETLKHKIGMKLEREHIARLTERTGQWLGALQYYQEKSLSYDNISVFLKELASLVVDLAPVTFCRIIFSDNNHEYFKTACLAQVRDLNWPARDSSKIKLPENALHKKALMEKEPIFYDLAGRGGESLTTEEKINLIPSGIKHGLIVPLFMGDRHVGSLTVGDARNRERSPLNNETALFIYSVAGLISMTLTRHKEKRAFGVTHRGKRTLMIKRREMSGQAGEYDGEPSLRSRLNGPLAGILASCEYMRSRDYAGNADIGRFIEVIQRNATKIHDITLERSEMLQTALR